MQNEDFVASIVDVGDQSALIVTDVENNAIADDVRILPTAFYISEVFPVGCDILDHFVPGRKRSCPLRMFLAGVADLLSAYYPHNKSSQIAKYSSSCLRTQKARLHSTDEESPNNVCRTTAIGGKPCPINASWNLPRLKSAPIFFL
jgi:hypothetical protein